MHTRRFAAFLLGAWLIGCLLMGYVSSQALQTTDRIMANPPGQVNRDIEDLGSDVTRTLLRFEASEISRFLQESWGVLQLGLGAAFISCCIFTAHRSKMLIIMSAAMIVIVAVQFWYVLPAMAALGRSFDFMPLGAATREREAYQSFHLTGSVLEVLKMLIGFVMAVRLLFDRYAWQQRLAGAPRRVERRRRRHHRADVGHDRLPERAISASAAKDATTNADDGEEAEEEHVNTDHEKD